MQTASHNIISSSSQPKPTTPDSPHTIRNLEKHLGREKHITPQKAYKIAPDIAVSGNQQQQQQLETTQMASETFTTLIVHPHFMSGSPLQSIIESSSTDQSVSDAYVKF